MTTIALAAEADASDIFSSGNFREIVITFSYNCEEMYFCICSPENILGKLKNFLQFRALFGIIWESYVFRKGL